MKIAISAESTVDLPQDLLKKFEIFTLSLFVRLGEEEFQDGTFPCSKIFDYVKNTKELPKTSAPNEADYAEHFENLLKTHDAIIHFSLSNKISSSYDHAVGAAKNFENVFVVDTLSLSTGIALQCLLARKLINEGKLSAKEIYEKVLECRNRVQTSFVLFELNYLYKGGRCNSLQYIGSKLLKITPQIVMKDGSMQSGKKFMGSSSGLYMKYVKAVLEEHTNPDFENVFITYTTCPDEIVATIKEELKARGFKNIYTTTAGATITSYCGKGTLGILFYDK